MSNNFVILDIDKTLIYAENITCDTIPNLKENQFIINSITYDDLFLINVRNHFGRFFNFLKEKKIKILVWSAGEESYVKQISNVLFGRDSLTYLLTNKHMLDETKNLNEIYKFIEDFDINKSVLVDDIVENGKYNPDKIIVIKPLRKNENDDELLNVIRKLEERFGL